jgi:hypothetical protein
MRVSKLNKAIPSLSFTTKTFLCVGRVRVHPLILTCWRKSSSFHLAHFLNFITSSMWVMIPNVEKHIWKPTVVHTQAWATCRLGVWNPESQEGRGLYEDVTGDCGILFLWNVESIVLLTATLNSVFLFQWPLALLLSLFAYIYVRKQSCALWRLGWVPERGKSWP